ncbi:MAG: TetR/AcrR family transcriptional regulator [Polyangiaceae bacterium]
MSARKEEILVIATRLFAERGYQGASMGDLAERVGLRKASLFHHYVSKDALYCAVLERLVGSIGELVLASMVAPGPFAERLDRLSDGIFDAMVAEPHAAPLLVREMMDWGPFARTQFEAIAKPLLDASQAFLESGQTDGVAPKRDARQIVLTLTGLHLLPFAIGQVVQRAFETEPDSPEFIAARRIAVREHVRHLVLSS